MKEILRSFTNIINRINFTVNSKMYLKYQKWNHNQKLKLTGQIPGKQRFIVDLAHLYIVWHLLFMQNTIIACQEAIPWVLLNWLWVSLAYLFPHRLWRLSQVRLFRFWFKGVPSFYPLTAPNVWKASPLKGRHKETIIEIVEPRVAFDEDKHRH